MQRIDDFNSWLHNYIIIKVNNINNNSLNDNKDYNNNNPRG